MKDPRHILITGASSGIGAALALDYAAPGVCLSLHGRNAERLNQVAEHARQSGAEAHIHTSDIADARDMETWILSRDSDRAIDLLIANAGISGGTAQGENADQVSKIFATNVAGVFNSIHPILPRMKARQHGQIAIISSIASFRGFPGAPAYCASKAAVRIYGEGLRGEMQPHHIEINVVCPGFIKTPMTDVNPFPMPLIMSAERAARIIRNGLIANHARIVFPFRLYMFIRLLAALPQPVMDFVARFTPKK